MSRDGKPTIYDIAKTLGISAATVSRALNPRTRAKVAPATLAEIERLAGSSGYTPNLAARNLRAESFGQVGLLFPHERGTLPSDYYMQILAGASDSLLGTDYGLKLMLTKGPGAKRDGCSFRTGEGIDGLLLTSWRSIFPDASAFDHLTVPCVIMNSAEKNIRARFVAADHEAGGRMAAEYLWGRGHRHVAVIGGSSGAPDAEARRRGFYRFFEEKKAKASMVPFFDANFEEEKAYGIVPVIFRQNPRTTAIFCMNDSQAYGVLRRLRELGLKCPGSISVMGYDGETGTAHTDPPLTTVKVPVYALARTAAGDLVRRLKGELSDAEFYASVSLKTELVERASVHAVS